MPIFQIQYVGLSLALMIFFTSATSFADSAVISYGNFKQMIMQKQTAGVVDLNTVLAAKHIYALGAIEQGKGEIVTINGDTWLDYGDDGIGQAVKTIPHNEQAVILAMATVPEWQSVNVEGSFDFEQLKQSILVSAQSSGIDIDKPFPFLLKGNFNHAVVHVINGLDPKFSGHGGKHFLYERVSETLSKINIEVVGFYSASTQGVYTHGGSSWHFHGKIVEGDKAIHIDDLNLTGSMMVMVPAD